MDDLPDKYITGFMMTLIGARRSGKSTLMRKIIKSPEFKKHVKEENIFIICPTVELTGDYDELPKARLYPKPDKQIIKDIMDEQKYNITHYGKKRTPEVLIIFDDCATDNIIRFGGIFDDLGALGRHFKINVMVSSQRLSAVSRTVRINSDYFIMFSPYNFSEAEQFFEQYVAKQDRKQLIKQLQDIWDVPYSYVVVDNSEKSTHKKLKLGFNKPIHTLHTDFVKIEIKK